MFTFKTPVELHKSLSQGNLLHVWALSISWELGFETHGRHIFCRQIMNHWSLRSHVVCSKIENSKFSEFALIFGPLCYYVCTHIWTLFLKFALIFGPSCVRVCTHIWTDLWSSLHSYLDRPVTKFALIFGPTCYEVCTNIWTHLLWSLHSYLDRPVNLSLKDHNQTRFEW